MLFMKNALHENNWGWQLAGLAPAATRQHGSRPKPTPLAGGYEALSDKAQATFSNKSARGVAQGGLGDGRERRQGHLEPSLVPQQTRERDLAAGFMHVAAYQREARAVRGLARRVRQCRITGLEDQLDRLAIAQPGRHL